MSTKFTTFVKAFIIVIGMAGCEESVEDDSPSCPELSYYDEPDYCQRVRDREAALAQENKEELDFQESCRDELRGYLKAHLCNRNESFCGCRARLTQEGGIDRYTSCPDEFADVKLVVQGEEVWIGGAWDDDWLSGKSAAFQRAYYAKRERDEARALRKLKKELRPIALNENALQALLGAEDYATLQVFYSVDIGEEGTVKLYSRYYEEGDPHYPSGGYDNPEEERQAELRLSCSLKRLSKKLWITRYSSVNSRCEEFPCYPSHDFAFRLTRIAAKSKR